jgi:hypothetical protein
MPWQPASRFAGQVVAAALAGFAAASAWAQDEAALPGEGASLVSGWLELDLNRGMAAGEAGRSPSSLRLMLGGGTGISVVTDAGGDAPSAAAAVLPRSDRLAQQEIARHADAEIGLAIGIAKGVDLVPAYGLHWTGNEAEGIESDVSHRFTFGARIGF